MDLTTEEALAALPTRGEFVVLVSDQKRVGSAPLRLPTDDEVVALFESVRGNQGFKRRDAINHVAGAYALSSKAVYSIIERMKVSGK